MNTERNKFVIRTKNDLLRNDLIEKRINQLLLRIISQYSSE